VTTSASILVADDDDISARFLKRLLTREGHHVSVVGSADEVLAACAAQSPDIVLLDLVAPGGRGFDICRQLKEQPSTRFVPVVIGDFADQEDVVLTGYYITLQTTDPAVTDLIRNASVLGKAACSIWPLPIVKFGLVDSVFMSIVTAVDLHVLELSFRMRADDL